jgi:hypothetical protein
MDGFFNGTSGRRTTPSPLDAATAGRGNPWRFHRSAELKKAMDGFFNGTCGLPRVGGTPATSPDVRCGLPGLRSLHVRCASASLPSLASIARRHGWGTPYQIAVLTKSSPTDAATAGRGNPWRFHRSAELKKAMDGFFNGKF